MGSTPIPGSNRQTHVIPSFPLSPAIKERIFKTLWSMKNDGYCEGFEYVTDMDSMKYSGNASKPRSVPVFLRPEDTWTRFAEDCYLGIWSPQKRRNMLIFSPTDE